MASVIRRHARGLVVAAAVVAIASMAYGDSPIELTNGVPIAGLSGDAGSQVDYKIVVPPGQGELEISISGGTGDCDLYVRYDQPPTYSAYDYRPYVWGNNETVTITNPAAGSWYIMLRGRNAYSGVTLIASYEPAVPTELENGVPQTGISGGHNSDRLYYIDVPAGQNSLEVNTWDGTGDVDVYVKFGSAPSEFDYDDDAYGIGTEQAASISSPAAGRWYIVLHTSYHYNDVSLRAVYGTSGPAESVMDDVVIPNLSGALGSETLYVIDAPNRDGGLDFRIYGGTGNCDMYIKKGMRPTTSDYDDQQTGPGNSESVFISTSNLGGPWYILLVGTEAYSGVTLQVHFVPSSEPLPEPGPKPDEKVTPLTPGVPVPDLAGKAGSALYFKIDVPDYVKTLTIKMSGGTGDADLYIRKGQLPTTTE
ncbi:MAG: PPC domain-containing protein [Planctomycetes bacterium]|nr:PPC domain-containing protein [Planctomycetota bacterium]